MVRTTAWKVSRGIADADRAACYHPRKYAEPGHDAIAGLQVDGAARMTDLPKLGHDQFRLAPDPQPAAQTQSSQVESRHDHVLREIAGLKIQQSFPAHGLDVVRGQQADLPMPWAGVGIALDAVIREQPDEGNRRLFLA